MRVRSSDHEQSSNAVHIRRSRKAQPLEKIDDPRRNEQSINILTTKFIRFDSHRCEPGFNVIVLRKIESTCDGRRRCPIERRRAE